MLSKFEDVEITTKTNTNTTINIKHNKVSDNLTLKEIKELYDVLGKYLDKTE
jgi:hypothetical protein